VIYFDKKTLSIL